MESKSKQKYYPSKIESKKKIDDVKKDIKARVQSRRFFVRARAIQVALTLRIKSKI